MGESGRVTAVALLEKVNQHPFHLSHTWIVEAAMLYFSKESVYAEEAEFWCIADLLHGINLEKFPEAHCKRPPQLLL